MNQKKINTLTVSGISIEIHDINVALADANDWINTIKTSVIMDIKGFGEYGKLTEKDIHNGSFTFQIQDIFNIEYRDTQLTIKIFKRRTSRKIIERFEKIFENKL